MAISGLIFGLLSVAYFVMFLAFSLSVFSYFAHESETISKNARFIQLTIMAGLALGIFWFFVPYVEMSALLAEFLLVGQQGAPVLKDLLPYLFIGGFVIYFVINIALDLYWASIAEAPKHFLLTFKHSMLQIGVLGSLTLLGYFFFNHGIKTSGGVADEDVEKEAMQTVRLGLVEVMITVMIVVSRFMFHVYVPYGLVNRIMQSVRAFLTRPRPTTALQMVLSKLVIKNDFKDILQQIRTFRQYQ